MVLTRGQLIAAIAFSLILAIPLVTLISAMVIFPIFVFGALGIFANAAPVLLLIMMGLRRMGLRLDSTKLLNSWQFSAIVWIGCAYGLSHWGDGGSTLGARNLPYFKVLFAPWLYLMGERVF